MPLSLVRFFVAHSQGPALVPQRCDRAAIRCARWRLSLALRIHLTKSSVRWGDSASRALWCCGSKSKAPSRSSGSLMLTTTFLGLTVHEIFMKNKGVMGEMMEEVRKAVRIATAC